MTIQAPIEAGQEIRILKKVTAAPGTEVQYVKIDCDSALFSLFVESLSSGTLDVEVFTYADNELHSVSILKFPTVTAPTTDLLLKKIATSMSNLRIVATWTGTATFHLFMRGLNAGETSLKIVGPAKGSAKSYTVTTSPGLLIPPSTQDRYSLIITNNNSSGTLYIGFTLAEATPSNGYPIGPKGQLGLDLEAGASIYAVGTTTIDVRTIEAQR